jgi:hypothetical protein
MTKNILLIAAAVVALGAAPAFAETAKMAPSSMSKSTGKTVHAKKVHQAKVVHTTKSKSVHHAKANMSQNAQEKAITRDLNKNGMKGA